MTHDPGTVHATRAASFTHGADVYARVRPGYPDAIVGWMLPDRAVDVVDLAAGTGKLTEALVARGLTVTAVEPAAAMRAELAARIPSVRVLEGTAERIPLPDACVDAVVVGTAWHWFDETAAGTEIARVLRPGGRLGIVRNDRDETVDWLTALGRILHDGDPLEPGFALRDFDPQPGAAFGPVEHTGVRWSDRLPRAWVRDLAATRSRVLSMDPADREALLDEVDALVAAHPDLAARDTVDIPYVARAARTDLLPAT